MTLELPAPPVFERRSGGLVGELPRPGGLTENPGLSPGKSVVVERFEKTLLSLRDCGDLFGRVGGESLAILRLHDDRVPGIRTGSLLGEGSWTPFRRELFDGFANYH